MISTENNKNSTYFYTHIHLPIRYFQPMKLLKTNAHRKCSHACCSPKVLKRFHYKLN